MSARSCLVVFVAPAVRSAPASRSAIRALTANSIIPSPDRRSISVGGRITERSASGSDALVALVKRHPASFTHTRHVVCEGRVAANARREHVAPLSLLLDQHPSCVRRWTCLERHVPEHAVALVDEVGQRESLVRELLHVVRKRSHARKNLLSMVLM